MIKYYMVDQILEACFDLPLYFPALEVQKDVFSFLLSETNIKASN